jgi:hypothetical protein
MACLEDPPRSFSDPRAALIMSIYFGWAAGTLGFEAFFFAGAAVSAIFTIDVKTVNVIPDQNALSVFVYIERGRT